MSIIKHPDQRVAVFIDAQNLYHSAQRIYGKNVDFGKILDHAVAGRKLIRAIAYVIASENKDEASFFEALTKRGIETKVKDLQVFSSGAKKGDWDVGLAVDAIKMGSRMDAIILVSGDGDYVPLVEYLQTMTQVEAVAFGQSTSGMLREAVDDFIDISENPGQFLIGFRPSSKRRGSKKNTKNEGGEKE